MLGVPSLDASNVLLCGMAIRKEAIVGPGLGEEPGAAVSDQFGWARLRASVPYWSVCFGQPCLAAA